MIVLIWRCTRLRFSPSGIWRLQRMIISWKESLISPSFFITVELLNCASRYSERDNANKSAVLCETCEKKLNRCRRSHSLSSDLSRTLLSLAPLSSSKNDESPIFDYLHTFPWCLGKLSRTKNGNRKKPSFVSSDWKKVNALLSKNESKHVSILIENFISIIIVVWLNDELDFFSRRRHFSLDKIFDPILLN